MPRGTLPTLLVLLATLAVRPRRPPGSTGLRGGVASRVTARSRPAFARVSAGVALGARYRIALGLDQSLHRAGGAGPIDASTACLGVEVAVDSRRRAVAVARPAPSSPRAADRDASAWSPRRSLPWLHARLAGLVLGAQVRYLSSDFSAEGFPASPRSSSSSAGPVGLVRLRRRGCVFCASARLPRAESGAAVEASSGGDRCRGARAEAHLRTSCDGASAHGAVAQHELGRAPDLLAGVANAVQAAAAVAVRAAPRSVCEAAVTALALVPRAARRAVRAARDAAAPAIAAARVRGAAVVVGRAGFVGARAALAEVGVAVAAAARRIARAARARGRAADSVRAASAAAIGRGGAGLACLAAALSAAAAPAAALGV